MRKILYYLAFTVIVLTLLVPGCSGTSNAGKGPINVGSKLDLEGQLLAQMIILMLENNGFEAVDQSSFGATNVVREALENGELDMYPEYTGNGAFFFGEAGEDVWKDLERGYQRVKELDKAEYGIDWLRPVPITNDWAIAIPGELALEEDLKTLDDFAEYINAGGYVKLIGSEEFVTSPAALPAFQEAYGFTLGKDQIITVASGDTTQTEKAASEGTSDVNAAMAYTTDGGLSAYGLVVLIDNRAVNPIYAPAPRVRGEILEKYPEIAGILNPVFESLDLETLQSLNEKTAVVGESPADVAGGYLTAKGFLK